MKLYPLAVASTLTLALSVPTFATPLIHLHSAELRTSYQIDILPHLSNTGEPERIQLNGESTSNNPYTPRLESTYSSAAYVSDRGQIIRYGSAGIINNYSSNQGLDYQLLSYADNGYSFEGFSGYDEIYPGISDERLEVVQETIDSGYRDVTNVSDSASILLDFTVLEEDASLSGYYERYSSEDLDFSITDITDEPMTLFLDSGPTDTDDGYRRFVPSFDLTLEKDRRYQIYTSLHDAGQFSDNNLSFNLTMPGNIVTSVDAPSSLALLMGSLLCLVGLRKRNPKQV